MLCVAKKLLCPFEETTRLPALQRPLILLNRNRKLLSKVNLWKYVHKVLKLQFQNQMLWSLKLYTAFTVPNHLAKFFQFVNQLRKM